MSHKEHDIGVSDDVIDKIDHIEIHLWEEDKKITIVHYHRQRMSNEIDKEAFDIMWKSILHADDIIQTKKQWIKDREEYLEYLKMRQKFNSMSDEEIERFGTVPKITFYG